MPVSMWLLVSGYDDSLIASIIMVLIQTTTTSFRQAKVKLFDSSCMEACSHAILS